MLDIKLIVQWLEQLRGIFGSATKMDFSMFFGKLPVSYILFTIRQPIRKPHSNSNLRIDGPVSLESWRIPLASWSSWRKFWMNFSFLESLPDATIYSFYALGGWMRPLSIIPLIILNIILALWLKVSISLHFSSSHCSLASTILFEILSEKFLLRRICFWNPSFV